jgi:competence protein ComEA
VTVHVVGQVKRPGVLHVPGGSRVADAVAAAGGAGAGADPSAINLARVVVDGEQIRVPKLGEQSVGSGAVVAGTGTSSVGSADGSTAGVLVNLNSASVADLDQLPGVGPVLAQRIVDWRAEHGRFASVDELGEVSGIGDKIFAQLRPKVTV